MRGQKEREIGMNKKLKIFFAFLVVIILSFCIGTIKNPMIRVNEHKIFKEEYLFYVQQGKSNIYNYFYHKYGVQAGDLEWEKDYGDGTPIDRLIQYCNTQIIQNSLIWQEAYEREITNYYTFEDFKKVWKHEMERRKKDHAAGEIVYGPLEMDLIEYYDYVLSDLRSKVMEAVWQVDPYTEEDLEAYFDEIKVKNYVRDDQIEGIKISTTNLGKEGKQALEEVRQLLMDSNDINKILEEIKISGEFEVTELTLGEETSRQDVMKQPHVKEELLKLSDGEISPIFVNDTSMDIIIVTSIEQGEYYSFEEMKGGIEQRCKEQVMDEYMTHKLEASIPKINYGFIKKTILEGF